VTKVSPERLLRGHTDRLVAVYRAAWACHLPPTKAVATAFNLTTGAAEQRGVSARWEGLLPSTDAGRRGLKNGIRHQDDSRARQAAPGQTG
jgi:hypothetical protein